jgi:hypothetical protein
VAEGHRDFRYDDLTPLLKAQHEAKKGWADDRCEANSALFAGGAPVGCSTSKDFMAVVRRSLQPSQFAMKRHGRVPIADAMSVRYSIESVHGVGIWKD